MRVELRVPAAGESITEVQIADWLKRAGDPVRQDEAVVLLETDKAAMELPSPVAGVLTEIVKQKGETAKVGEVLAYVEEAPVGEAAAPKKEAPAAQPTTPTAPAQPKKPAPAAEATTSPVAESPRVMPAARRLMAERGIESEAVTPSGPGGRLLKEDVVRHLDQAEAAAPATATPAAAPPAPAASRPAAGSRVAASREEEAVPMSPLRRRVAERLVRAQQTAALLTTFNEIDMSAVMALRRAHQDAFQQRHGVKLGFMSFFVKTVIEALKQCPELNGEIRGTDIVYRNYFDIGIAVGGGRGLVVPVLRHAERLSFAEIERAIADFAGRAQANKLTPEELQGGTFTISNGGVYGSLLSTPIVNPPQSGVLGLHVIQDRPVAREGQVVIRSMMYVALTYDHRIVDGREAVGFLKHVKDCMEEPARLLLEM
ncbi:MAG TPA: 2-oxoglutarate dehydrogenase complex dihydrolipoyllysine-residue succinyltransferase [Methylomirabilota bacterium]